MTSLTTVLGTRYPTVSTPIARVSCAGGLGLVGGRCCERDCLGKETDSRECEAGRVGSSTWLSQRPLALVELTLHARPVDAALNAVVKQCTALLTGVVGFLCPIPNH